MCFLLRKQKKKKIQGWLSYTLHLKVLETNTLKNFRMCFCFIKSYCILGALLTKTILKHAAVSALQNKTVGIVTESEQRDMTASLYLKI